MAQKRGAARAVRSHAWHLLAPLVLVVVVRALTSDYLRQASQNLGKYTAMLVPNTNTSHLHSLYTTPTQTTTESARCYAGGRKRGVAHIDTCHRLFGQDTNFHSGDPIEVG